MNLKPMGILLWAIVAAAGVRGQTAPAKPEFEVASVKLSDPGGRGMSMNGGPGTDDPERVSFGRYNLESFILEAYGVQTYQVTGPGWLVGNFGPASVKVDVAAKLPPGTTREQYRLMLQNLLAERFGLVLHHEKKDTTVYELVVAKNGPKFKPSPKATPTADDPHRPSGMPAMTFDSAGFPILSQGVTMIAGPGGARMHNPNETMEQFADFLSRSAGRPVREATGLKGEFDIGLFWGGDEGALGSITLEEAVQDQLGLKLNSVKGQVDVLVIDHMEKVPTPN